MQYSFIFNYFKSMIIFSILSLLFFLNFIVLYVEASVEKPDILAGSKLFEEGDLQRGIVACSTCHGIKGNSVMSVYPNLSSQPYEYLVKQLIDFRIEKNQALPIRNGLNNQQNIMNHIAQLLSLKDVQNLSLYLSKQILINPNYSKNENTNNKGEKIWRNGIEKKGVPACAACHGPNGKGIPGQYPRLSGQFSNYLSDQLKLFRDGYRRTNAAMHTVSHRMADYDIEVVADYATGLR